jgi:hypothetical protein
MENLEKHVASSDKADQLSGEMLEIRGNYTAEEEKAVLRKIDMVILPFVSDSYHCLEPHRS